MAGNLRWFKGNTHTHTTLSDGDISPDEVTSRYADLGYDFLAITDHGVYTPVEEFESHGLSLIGGIELGGSVPRPIWIMNGLEENTPIHVVGLGVTQHAESYSGDSSLDALQKMADSAVSAGGLAILAHPNYWWGFDDRELVQVNGCEHFELTNVHPACSPYGDDEHASVEVFWDRCLSAGRRYYGVASDDAHQYRQLGPGYANPGRAWIVVRAKSDSSADLFDAIRRGDFYASTGVALAEYTVTDSEITVAVDETSTPDGFEILFKARNGQIRAAGNDNPATYKLRGDEMYVRVKVKAPDDRYAWTQPVFLADDA